MDSTQGLSRVKSFDRLHKASEKGKPKLLKKVKKYKANFSNSVGEGFKKIDQQYLKCSFGSVIDLVTPIVSVRRACTEVTAVYKKLDTLLAEGKNDEFHELVIETVKSLGFITPYAKPDYESKFEYAMPYYFLTGMKGLLSKCHTISMLSTQPDKLVRCALQSKKPSGGIAPWIKSGCVAANCLFQLNILINNLADKENIKVESSKIYLPGDSEDFIFCKIFEKEQFSNLNESLRLLSQFSFEISDENIDTAFKMLPHIRQSLDVLSLFSREEKIQRSDFLVVIKEAVLTARNPFSMASLYEALPILEDKDPLQLSSVASTLPL